MSNPRPRLLIEDWLPAEAVGVESVRESGYGTPFPAPKRLHVWWARRPLAASRAAILASSLPAYAPDDWPSALRERFPTEASYREWVLHLFGIRGDPVAARKILAAARARGEFITNPYGSPRAFTVSPDPADLCLLGDLLEVTWGERAISLMDVTAGGGSIPFEALRYGFTTIANELNPVASVILKATLDYPARFGPDLVNDIRKWGDYWYSLAKIRLQPYFTPLPLGVEGAAYLWARTVACPTTGKPVPLSPNWWLSKEGKGVAAQLVIDPAWDSPRFVIGAPGEMVILDPPIPAGVRAVRVTDPDTGTIKRGTAISPWTNEVVDGDYIKAEAQAGRMGQMLYAVATKQRGGFRFRAPAAADLDAVAHAEAALAEALPGWRNADLVPNEPILEGNKTDEPRRYGSFMWADMFSPRQLLAMGVFMETLRETSAALRRELPEDRAEAVEAYLAIALDKIADYNAILATWEVSRQVVKHVFKRHDFAFSWTYGEFDAAANLLPWAIDQATDAYKDLAKLLVSADYPLWDGEGGKPVDRLTIQQGSATHLSSIPSGSIHNITFDPPYYDNVMYAELSDFFYVWLKRSAGHLFPEFFRAELTDKDDEAVANVARFEGMKKKKDMAKQDYERKMAAIFRECARVLRDDGALTIMFTHKQVEAWDTLAAALIGAGFVIEASWPVHTESEHSLHQAKKNAASSTILLACRKRAAAAEPVWWDDAKGAVRRAAREKAAEFAAQGVRGVDLYISAFGPALSALSQQWPVLSGEVDADTGSDLPVRPEVALDLAREEVIALRKQGLLDGRKAEFDPVTDWYLMAWDAFRAAEFPYDEARKLAIAVGVDLDKDIRDRERLIVRKSSSVVLQEPGQRRRKGVVDPDAMFFEHLIDAAHTAMMTLQDDGARAAEQFLKRAGLLDDVAFRNLIQALLQVIPRGRSKGQFVRVEAGLLERLRLQCFPDLDVPAAEDEAESPEQIGLGGAFEDGEDGDEGDEE